MTDMELLYTICSKRRASGEWSPAFQKVVWRRENSAQPRDGNVNQERAFLRSDSRTYGDVNQRNVCIHKKLRRVDCPAGEEHQRVELKAGVDGDSGREARERHRSLRDGDGRASIGVPAAPGLWRGSDRCFAAILPLRCEPAGRSPRLTPTRIRLTRD